MTLNLTVPQHQHTDFTPQITVIGVGGGGTNAVDNMISLNLQGVDFVVANTDAQQLLHSRADRRVQLGPHITQGLGAGAKPEIGRAAAEEAAEELYRHLDGAHMVFITAGMGGGTGTGAAPVIARMARERNILTVGVVTKPFSFEGPRRARAAELGIEELQEYVDTLIVIPNQNLFRLANERTSFREAFKMADHVLYMGVRGVTDLMVVPGLVNLDFADIRTVMAEMGKAMMGTGEADGENRAVRAAEAAINNPLLEDTSMAGARGLLINITGGDDMTLFEVDHAANRIREEVDEDANIIFGSAVDESLNGRIRVSVVATGIDTPREAASERPRLVALGGGYNATEAASGAALDAAPPRGGAAQTAAAQTPVTQTPMTQTPMAQTGAAPHTGAVTRVMPLYPRASQDEAAPRPPFAAHPEDVGHGQEAPRFEPVPQAMPARAPEARQAEATALEARDAAARDASRGEPRLTTAAAEWRGLFATAARRPPAAPAPQAAPAPRPSLFGTVTGLLRGNFSSARTAETGPESGARRERYAEEAPRETPRPSVRPAAEEDVGLEIPTFLRRQTS